MTMYLCRCPATGDVSRCTFPDGRNTVVLVDTRATNAAYAARQVQGACDVMPPDLLGYDRPYRSARVRRLSNILSRGCKR
jgi:hypothetical protein